MAVTLDEAIRHCYEVYHERDDMCKECRDEHRQLAQWLEELKRLKTADVVEVKHGEWIDEFKSFNAVGSGGAERSYLVGYKCSLCGRSEISKEPYCNCGAKMDR